MKQPDNGFPLSDLRRFGLLWLINRVVFHPRGMALGLHYETAAAGEPEGEPFGFSILRGSKPEPWQFRESDDNEGFRASNSFLAAIAAMPHEPSEDVVDPIPIRPERRIEGRFPFMPGCRFCGSNPEIDESPPNSRGETVWTAHCEQPAQRFYPAHGVSVSGFPNEAGARFAWNEGDGREGNPLMPGPSPCLPDGPYGFCDQCAEDFVVTSGDPAAGTFELNAYECPYCRWVLCDKCNSPAAHFCTRDANGKPL